MAKNFKYDYKQYVRNTAPDMNKLWDKIEKEIDEREQNDNTNIKPAQITVHKNKRSRTFAAAAAAVLILTVGVTAVTKLNNNSIKNDNKTDYSYSEKSASVETEDKTNENKVIEYEQLSFGGTSEESYNADYKPQGSEYFVEKDVLEETEFFADVTVKNAQYNSKSADYTFKVNSIVSKSGKISESNITVTSSTPYLLCEGREYFIPLKKENGSWKITFENAPQIEITLDDEVVFQNGWSSLDENAQDVQKPQDNVNDFYYDRMKYSYKDDLTKLVEQWQSI